MPGTAGSSRASTSRTPPTRSASAPEKVAISRAVVEGCRPGDLEAIGITASPCGGCRQWLYEFRLDRVTFRNRDGEVVSYTPAELLPDTWELD